MHHETETYSQYFFFLIFFLVFIWFPLQCNIFTPNKPKNKVSTKKNNITLATEMAKIDKDNNRQKNGKRKY